MLSDVVTRAAAAGPGSELAREWMDPLPSRFTFAEISNMNLSDKIPQHIFTSDILFHLLDLVGGQQKILDRGQIAINPIHHKEVLLEDEHKISPDLLVKLYC